MGTIRVRYKHGALPGDPSAFNAIGAANGFPRLVYGGDEHDIPDEELDDKEPFINYRFPDKSEKMITEKEHRAMLYKYGGFRGPLFNDPAPASKANGSIISLPREMTHKETVEFLEKQRLATLKYKHFNPMCMEIISEIPGEKEKKQDAPAGKDKEKIQDITKMKPKDAIEYLKTIKDESTLNDMMILLDKSEQPHPAVISQVEMMLRNFRKQ